MFKYTLHSPNGCFDLNYMPLGGARLHKPAEWYERTHQSLESLHQGFDSYDAPLTPAEVKEDLAALGEELCDNLFSSELLWTLREVQDADTVLLITDEPWIPWEIVKPFDDEGDGGFLSSSFQLTRWLAGGNAPASLIEVDRLTVVETGSSLSQQRVPLSVHPTRRG